VEIPDSVSAVLSTHDSHAGERKFTQVTANTFVHSFNSKNSENIFIDCSCMCVWVANENMPADKWTTQISNFRKVVNRFERENGHFHQQKGVSVSFPIVLYFLKEKKIQFVCTWWRGWGFAGDTFNPTLPGEVSVEVSKFDTCQRLTQSRQSQQRKSSSESKDFKVVQSSLKRRRRSGPELAFRTGPKRNSPI